MKWIKVFSLFVLLHVAGWAAAHVYRLQHPDTVLLVADTSYSLKPHFVDMQRWIEDYAAGGRYQRILIGTDKAMLGDLAEIKSRQSIFRTAFGRSSSEDLRQFDSIDANERILLSDGELNPPGWTLVTFR